MDIQYQLFTHNPPVPKGQKINKSPIQGISETLNIDFRTPKTLKDNQEEGKFLKELNADLGWLLLMVKSFQKSI